MPLSCAVEEDDPVRLRDRPDEPADDRQRTEQLDGERSPRAPLVRPAARLPSGCWSRSRSSPVPPVPGVLRPSDVAPQGSVQNSGAAVGHHRVVRVRIIGVVAVDRDGRVDRRSSRSRVRPRRACPSYTNGYAKWPRINAQAVHEVRPALCPQRRQERLREQEEGRHEVPERHRRREDGRAVRRQARAPEPGRGRCGRSPGSGGTSSTGSPARATP